MPPRRRRRAKDSSCPQQSVCLAEFQEGETTKQDLSNDDSTQTNGTEQPNLDLVPSSPTCSQQNVGQVDLQDNTNQAKTTKLVLLECDAKETNVTVQLNLDQETSTPSCPQQSQDRAEFQDNSHQIEVSIPKNVQQLDIVSEAQGTPQVKKGNEEEDLNDLTTVEIAENEIGTLPGEEEKDMIEIKVFENLHHQMERLFDLIENLEQLNRSQWSSTKTLQDGLDKLQFLKKRANQIKEKSIDLPEFMERRPMKDRPEYDYINKLLQAWRDVKKHVAVAKDIVHELPISVTKSKETPRKVSSSTSSLVSELRRKNALKNQELDKRAKEIAARSAIASNKGEALKSTLRIQPGGEKLEQNLEVQPSVGIDQRRNLTLKCKQSLPDLKPLKVCKSTFDVEKAHENDIFPEDSVSQLSQSHFQAKNGYGQFGNERNRAPSSQANDWVCIPTEKNPGTEKPLHHGKIRSFRNLFENSFRMSFLFNPNSRDHSQIAFSIIKSTSFDGNNVEQFREFEQSVLIRIINNNSLDFDEKFLSLLDTLGGSPLAVVQVFTDELDAPNFVRAIEALYYAYGEPSKFRDALLRQLINEDPIDIRYPESFLKINYLISRVFRAFGGNNTGNQVLSMSCILESIKMTPETSLAYRTWLCSAMKEKSLKVLQQWLEWMYQDHVSENLFRKPVVKIPPIITNVTHTNYQEILKGRCRLCFGKIHNLEGCHVYMSMTPNQRKIALLIYGGCFRCTRIVQVVHIGSNCNFCEQRDCWRPCENCQSSDHHFSICEASDEPFTAVLKQ